MPIRHLRQAALAAIVTTLCGGASLGAAAATAAPTSEPTAPGSGGACPGATLRPTKSDGPALADATICLINRARLAHRLPALTASTTLDAAARVHSGEMFVHHFLGHDSAAGKPPREQVLATAYSHGASDVAVGQNVAWGDGSESTPRAVVSSWLTNAPHRAILMSKRYHEVGVGLGLGGAHSKRGGLYTADLASRSLHG